MTGEMLSNQAIASAPPQPGRFQWKPILSVERLGITTFNTHQPLSRIQNLHQNSEFVLVPR